MPKIFVKEVPKNGIFAALFAIIISEVRTDRGGLSVSSCSENGNVFSKKQKTQ